ncbi:MAG: hypothetical protein JJU31_09975 [Wenzhouxiangella sp.]|nr:hypothetical protein [Wenzhouxiangella sp.]MCH8477068.1 hypothetical protein [Wenzhouxiangella sp.]
MRVLRIAVHDNQRDSGTQVASALLFGHPGTISARGPATESDPTADADPDHADLPRVTVTGQPLSNLVDALP